MLIITHRRIVKDEAVDRSGRNEESCFEKCHIEESFKDPVWYREEYSGSLT